ncbi:hypothetical protein CHU32_21585 [Superficieibacter electus]|uniref:Uncharacterized protein n=1 Tax=Superficieibacter electus TaxID=2022662 RepID=A0A2P5GJI6_9ENTR|nr:hypothetical protein [Superficieibacter electus]POP41861.1 hypothetical protein CHU33_21115 [Superficieibacter electus]POP44168.1 hypothetical protein CHU32_21585 [Superficieibacter electus]
MWFIYLLAIVVMVMVIASDIWPKGRAGASIAKMCLQFLKYGSLAWLFCLVSLFNSGVLLAILLLAVGRDLFKKHRAGEKIRYEVMRFVGWGGLAIGIIVALTAWRPL